MGLGRLDTIMMGLEIVVLLCIAGPYIDVFVYYFQGAKEIHQLFG
jgi:hypothetical protein